MGTRRLTCSWCGVVLPVPIEATGIYCPACSRYTPFQRDNYNSYLPYGPNRSGYNSYPRYGVISNANSLSSNDYATNLGYAAYGRLYRPGYTGRLSPKYTPHAHGSKRAVLCGITYKGHPQSLDGSINDVMLMKQLLVERFGFPTTSIIMLTGIAGITQETEEQDSSNNPSKKNIRAALQWLVRGCQPGDSLVFHYSGHGSQVRDLDGDELDGFDESLMPVDYQTEGRILDDELNATIVRPLPRGATLHSIIDTCYSGTFLDLPHLCRINRDGFYKWEDHRVPHVFKGTSGGLAICISACDDHQNSGDTTAFTGKATGALTHSFVQIVEQQPKLTYGHLLLTMHNQIRAAQEGLGIRTNASHSSQEPQLSSSQMFDVHSKSFTL